jgi:hypothetical protein
MLLPKSARPSPRRGLKPGKGRESVFASASTRSTPMLAFSPNSTTLFTLLFLPLPSVTSWKILKASVPVNARWMGEALPGRLVYSNCHLHARRETQPRKLEAIANHAPASKPSQRYVSCSIHTFKDLQARSLQKRRRRACYPAGPPAQLGR